MASNTPHGVLVVDFGAQYAQLIARRVREANVYSEIVPSSITSAEVAAKNPEAIILSGGPSSVYAENAPKVDPAIFALGIPTFGICYGFQTMAAALAGVVAQTGKSEFGRTPLEVKPGSKIFAGLPVSQSVWMSHGDTIKKIPSNYKIIASTSDVEIAGYHIEGEETYGIQFHPEVYHSTEGKILLKNFIVEVCHCACDWTPDSFVEETTARLKAQLGDDKVILGLSGGVDSSVAAVLLHKAIGANLHCIFVDNGLLRKNEFQSVLESYKGMGLNVKGVDASQQFYAALSGLTDPELKRKAIGKVFIDVFDEESKQVEGAKWLGQGTIYPDVIESVSATGGPSQTIKSHHNVGGLPDYMKLQVVEPLRLLFKDEVRRIGRSLQIDERILGRHPFPGPGLGIRILGEVTEEKVRILQDVDSIFIEGLKEDGLYDDVWQAGAIFLPIQSVGVMGDERTYENAVALRAVTSTDGMTADWCHLPYEFLAKISNKIINQVKGINRVTYDISSKPPATIEWE